MNEPQKEQTANQHGDGNPEMNVGEHDRHPTARLIRSAVLLHPDSSEAPEGRTLGGFAADDTIGKGGILLREKNYPLRCFTGSMVHEAAEFVPGVREPLRFDAPLVLNFMDSRPVAQLVRALP